VTRRRVQEPPSSAEVETPVGTARLWFHRANRPTTTLVLGHGAGGGIEARDLAALAEGLPAAGTTVVLLEQPWRVAGRRVAGPPAQLDRAFEAVLAALAARTDLADAGTAGTRLVVGGRSAGARVACRLASAVGADAVVALAFPLHPPGRPERSRSAELLGTGVPTLVVQGERDSFGTPAELPAGPDLLMVAPVPYADHGFKVPSRADLTQEAALELIVVAVTEFLQGLG
jgi:predicted alpha/beta-hydrolase family hydrolase